jgi:lambda family phage holin
MGVTLPWKDANNWMTPEIMAPFLSFALSFLRTIYHDNEPSWLRRLLESVICGMLTLSAGFGISAMGLSSDWKFAVAGAVGFAGTEYIRTVAQKFIERKIEK